MLLDNNIDTNLKDNSVLINNCILELSNQSINPPGNDKVIKSCYGAYIDLLSDPVIFDLTSDILLSRGFTPSHFVNIFFRAIQFIELYIIKSPNYPQKFDNTAVWKKELRIIFTKHYDLLKEILTTRDTTTTIYQRYAGSKIILNALFPNQEIKVADFGCGGNYGLPGLIKNVNFRTIKDNTKYSRATKLLDKTTHIIEGLAIDKEDPYKEDSKAWRMACSFYPHELNGSSSNFDQKFDLNSTMFACFDLTAIAAELKNTINKNYYNAVIMSTFLYQLNEKQVKNVMKFAKKLLVKNGVIIIQDFALKSENGKLLFINNWFSSPNSYRTFIIGDKTGWKLKEILRWDSGRCKEVSEGEDFKIIKKA